MAAQSGLRLYSDRVLAEVDDPLLAYFLDSFTAAVETEDWRVVLTFFDEEPYRIQTREFGIGDEQFIREAILAPGLDNQQLPSAPGDSGPFAQLESIDTIIITTVSRSRSGDVVRVSGSVTLFDGTTRDVAFMLVRRLTGEYEITSAVG